MNQNLTWRKYSNLFADRFQIKSIGLYGHKRLRESRRDNRASATSVLKIKPAIPDKGHKHDGRLFVEIGFIANGKASEPLSDRKLEQTKQALELVYLKHE